ncbi:MAG: hypothetical protein K2M97_08420 [Muribaculaceae bacterium]|nr:hypothetical protein [Muribaculaceae bacterium]
MNRFLILTTLILPFAAAALTTCGGHSQPMLSPAAERGEADAAALCADSLQLTVHDLTSALLAVRSREWQMRSQGFDDDADAYIEAFRQYVIDHNEDLAKELFF